MRKKRFFPLQIKILLLSLFVVIIPITTFGIISFNQTSQIMQQKISLSNMNTVEQIGNNIEFIVQNVHDISLYLIQNENVRTYFHLQGNESIDTIYHNKLKIESDLQQLISPKIFIDSIYIKGVNNLELNTADHRNELSPNTVSRSAELYGKPIWYLDTVYDYKNRPIKVLSMVRSIYDTSNITRKLAVMKINVNADAFYNIYKDKMIVESDEFFVLDNNDTIISATSSNKVGDTFDYSMFSKSRLNSDMGYFQIKFKGLVYLVTYYKFGNNGWKIINIVPLKQLLKDNTKVQDDLIITIIICFAVCTAIITFFSGRILARLKKLSKLMGKVENEDFDVYIEPKGNDEITRLYHSFNRMSAKLKELIQKVYSVQLKQREAELMALQAQINPHFLYNTLDNIYWMGRMEKAFETSKMVQALSKLFRQSLNNGEETTKVRNEIEHIKNYIIIQQIRYKDKITFSLNVEDDTLEYFTIKFVLQPLVENAIVHGRRDQDKCGMIDISVFKENGKLLFKVEDNGVGVDLDEINRLLEEPDGKRGMAIKNVNDRIQLFFGDEYGLKFIKKENGTTVIVTQPLIEEGKQ
ncbi:putative signal transduction protein with a C-terminal ATPase domain [[Clostridium] cellulosi]|uniref:Putative signal transduction protein with a C-terminal ATPase domain n=1 Tax=[Clostridium] cellulosi TaxID=29343 RepID=A0A078KRP1_9FIRM|nr:putative signal transduction protein with a C-terminal ATPase domain [[Clostridium] cellulosi]